MSDRDGSGFVWFLAGLGLGALAGVLYAPRSGAETRDQLLARAEEGREYMRHRAREARARGSLKETQDMTSRTRLRLALASLALFALFALGCGGYSGKEELVVGEYGSMTGNDADFGQSTKRGVDLAMSDLLAQKEGKIGGLPVRVVSEDDQAERQRDDDVGNGPSANVVNRDGAGAGEHQEERAEQFRNDLSHAHVLRSYAAVRRLRDLRQPVYYSAISCEDK